MASNSNSNQSSTSGFGSESSGSTPSLPSNIFEENEGSAPAPAPLKPGQKRAANVRAAKAAANASLKGPNASTLPPPNELLKPVNSVPKPKKVNSRKNKSKANANNTSNATSVEAVLTNEYPGRRIVRTNNGEIVNTSVGSSAFESSEESSIPEANRIAADRPNNRGLNDYPVPTFDEVDEGDADIPSETEEPEVANASAQPITSMADTSLYLLLRVGNDSSSEYIDLRKQPMASMGTFNTHTIGSTKEIQNLYGIRTSEGYKAMQRAFGVPRYGKKAPFEDYVYDKQCKFLGFDLVREALLQRIRTLEESLRIATQGTINSNRNKHFVDVLKKMVEAMSSVKKVCPVETKPAAVTSASAPAMTKPAKPSNVPKGCPCLEDLTLLRDLVYLVAMIQGTAIPEVKKQLESIPLSKLLNAAVKPEEKRNVVQKALEALKTVAAAEKILGTNTGVGTNSSGTGNAGVGTNSSGTAEAGTSTNGVVNEEQIQELLKLLWKTLTQEDRMDTVTKEEVVDRVQALLESVKEYETVKRTCDEMGVELDDLRKRHTALQEILGAVEENSSDDDPLEEIQRLLNELNEEHNKGLAKDAEIQNLREQLASKEQEFATLSSESTRKNANATTEKARLEAEIGVLNESLTKALADQSMVESQKSALLAGIEQLKGQIEGLKTEVSEADARLSATISEDLQIIIELERQLKTCQEEKAELVTAGSKKTEAVARQLEEKDGQITELNQKLAEAVAKATSSASEIESLRGQLVQEKAASEEKNDRITSLQRNLVAADISIGDVRKELRTLQAQIAALEAEHTKALEECTARETELRNQLTAEKGKVAGLEAAVASLSKALQEAEVAAARANVAEANSAQLKEQLGQSIAKLVAEEEAAKAAKAAHEAQMEAVSTELAGARAALVDLEKEIGDAKITSEAQSGQLEELRARIASLEAELEAKGASGSAAQKAFDEAKAALEAESETLKAALQKAQDEVDSIPAIDQARLAALNAQKAAEDKVAALQQQLSTLEAEKQARETNLTAAAAKKNSNMKIKEDEYKAEVDRLTRELGEAEAARKQAVADAVQAQATFEASSAQKNANSAVKSGQIAALTANRNARLEEIEELKRQVAEVESLKEVSVKKNATIAAKNAEIASLESSLAAAKAASSESGAAITQRDAEIAQMKADLAAAQEALVYAVEADKAAHQAEIDDLKQKLAATEVERNAAKEAGLQAVKERGETAEAEVSAATAAQQALIENLEKQIEELGVAFKKAISDEKEQTKTRLNTLLSMIVINDDMKEKAVQWWDSGDNKETLEKMSSELLEELCEFFQYLANVINLQQVKITTSLAKINKDFAIDIFKAFKEPATGFSKAGLRRDITILFQELFVTVGHTTTITKPITIDKELPDLHKALQFAIEDYNGDRDTLPNEPIALAPTKLSEFAAELGSFGFLSDVGVVPIAGNKITIRKQKNSNEFTKENEEHYTPLVILGIKYIQLLNEALNEKYSMLKARCAKA